MAVINRLLLVRILAFAALGLLAGALPQENYSIIFLCILFGHYLLQIAYTRHKKRIFIPEHGGTLRRLSLFAARCAFLGILLTLSMTWEYLTIVIYFGIHFVLSEVYTRELLSDSGWTKMIHALTSFCTYAIFVADLWPFFHLERYHYQLIGAFGVALLFLMRRSSLATYEAIGLLGASLYPATNTPLFDAILYHLLWWAFYPIKDLGKKGTAVNLRGYLVASAVLTGLFGVIYLIDAETFARQITDQAVFYGNIHITLSFALSASHPQFINRLFGKDA